jgi:replicative DNA helicase
MSLAAVEPMALANIETEYVLLATLLFDSKRVDVVADRITGADFADPFFGRVFDLIVREHGQGKPVSALTIRPFLEADPGYQELGGTKWLAGIASAAAGVVNAKLAAGQIADLAKRRRLMEALRDTLVVGADLSQPIGAVVDAADAAILGATETISTANVVTGAEAMAMLLKASETRQRSIRSHVIRSLDDLLGGMRPRQLVIGAGRPGMGKTAAALSYALGAAQAGHGVLFVSLEMGAAELSARIAADLAFDGRGGVPFSDINSDQPNHAARQAMGNAMAMLEDMPLHIVDAGSLTLGRLDMIVRRYRRRLAARGQSLDLVVVDYLQLLRTDDKKQSAYETVSEISRRLKAMAKDQDVCVFALAQLSRDVEKREDKRPHLSDLRDSGQIEQDADAVLFLYRHEYYVRQAEPKQGDPSYRDWEAMLADCSGLIDFICAKRRNGITGTATGQFHGAYQAVRG